MASNAKDGRGRPASGIRALAEALDVSVATVHRALHNQGRISEETRARVLRKAEELEYRPNLAARDLRRNRHFRISVHLPTTIASFFEALRLGIEEGAAPFHAQVDVEVHRYTRSPRRAEASMRSAIEHSVDGIIAVPANTEQVIRLVRKAQQQSIPVICVSTDVPESGRLTAVTPYPRSSGAMAAEVLATNTHKRGSVAVLAGDLANLHHTEKVRGFREMLAKIKPDLTIGAVIEAHDDPEQAYRGMLHCLRKLPALSGLYVSSANSIAALEAVRKAGRLHSFPIVTTDLFPELVPYLQDGSVKATIYQCPEIQGTVAIQALYRYLQDGIAPPATIGIIPQLVMRSNLDLYLNGPVFPAQGWPEAAL